MTRVHILSKKMIYIKLKIFLCVFHPIHEYFELSYEPVTLEGIVTQSLTIEVSTSHKTMKIPSGRGVGMVNSPLVTQVNLNSYHSWLRHSW